MIGVEIPQAAGLVFLTQKERPTEAPFCVFRKKICNEELQRIARLASKNPQITFLIPDVKFL